MPVGTMPGQGGTSRFDLARQRASQRAGAAGQQATDAVRRRFASLGGLNSGAAIKAQQMTEQQANQQKEESVQAIDAQEADYNANRDFEREKMSFQAAEAQKGRDFEGGQRGIDRAFQNKVFDNITLKQMDLAWKQYELQKDESKFNQTMATQQQNWNEKNTGGYFGAGGFLGLGLGG